MSCIKRNDTICFLFQAFPRAALKQGSSCFPSQDRIIRGRRKTHREEVLQTKTTLTRDRKNGGRGRQHRNIRNRQRDKEVERNERGGRMEGQKRADIQKGGVAVVSLCVNVPIERDESVDGKTIKLQSHCTSLN